jgi:hypothetical protein
MRLHKTRTSMPSLQDGSRMSYWPPAKLRLHAQSETKIAELLLISIRPHEFQKDRYLKQRCDVGLAHLGNDDAVGSGCSKLLHAMHATNPIWRTGGAQASQLEQLEHGPSALAALDRVPPPSLGSLHANFQLGLSCSLLVMASRLCSLAGRCTHSNLDSPAIILYYPSHVCPTCLFWFCFRSVELNLRLLLLV